MNELSFFDFKRKHSLGYDDICKITGCTLNHAKDWTQGGPVPHHIMKMLLGIDVVIDRIKTENGIFTDSDAQHAANIIEKQNIKIIQLEAELAQFRGRTGGYIEQLTNNSRNAGAKLINHQ